jgi:hypothetical protein
VLDDEQAAAREIRQSPRPGGRHRVTQAQQQIACWANNSNKRASRLISRGLMPGTCAPG